MTQQSYLVTADAVLAARLRVAVARAQKQEPSAQDLAVAEARRVEPSGDADGQPANGASAQDGDGRATG